jgi:TonB-dependent receptor
MKSLFITLLFSFTAFFAFAQKGTIQGQVIDTLSNEAVIGANVYLEGTTTGTITDIDGKFNFSAPVGTYTLVISLVSYKTKKISGVEVKAGQVLTINTTLAEDLQQLGEITVVGVRETQTEIALISEIKGAQVVVSGVSAEQISKSVDRDAAQVVRRIPGITLSGNGNAFVNIRGLSERYNPVMLHNAFAPSMEDDVRAFSFDIVPSNQLDRMLVFKSPSAENPGEFAGGVVKIFTKSIPAENSLSVSYRTQYRNGTTFQDFFERERGGMYWTGFNDGRLALPDNFPSDLRKVRSLDELTQAGRMLSNNWLPVQRNAPLDQALNISFAKKYETKGGKQIGNITSISYSNAFTTFNIERSDFNTFDLSSNRKSTIYTFNDLQYTQNTRFGVLHNWAIRLNKRNTIEWKNLFNQNSQGQYVSRSGFNFENGFQPENASFEQNYRGIFTTQVTGKHEFGDNENSNLDWVAGFNHAYSDRPDYKRYRIDVDPITGQRSILVPIGAAAAEFLGRFYSSMRESSATAAANYSRAFGEDKKLTLKTGFFTEIKDRTFKARNIGYVRANSAEFDKSLLEGSINDLFKTENINNTTGLRIDEQSNPSDSYSAQNRLIAGYLSSTYKPSEKFTLITGVRVENNLQELQSRTITNQKVRVQNPVTNVLPSASLTYNFNPTMLFRAAYGMTVNRPEFRELAPFGFYDFNFNFTNKGNPNLKNASIHNADLRWEFYPTPSEQITFGVFYKKFINPIEVFFVPGAGSGGAKTFTYENAQSATTMGIELELKKSFEGMTGSSFIDKFNMTFNTALMSSRVDLGAKGIGQSNNRPLQGQAPYIVNGGLHYEDTDKGIQVSAMYNVIGRRILFVGYEGYPDIYVMPRHVLDLSVTKTFFEKLQVRVGISDIMNNSNLLLQDGNQDGKFDRLNDQVIQSFKPGVLYSVGVNYKFY